MQLKCEGCGRAFDAPEDYIPYNNKSLPSNIPEIANANVLFCQKCLQAIEEEWQEVENESPKPM